MGGAVALIAALIAFEAVRQQIGQAEDLETRRRQRKHAALRAKLPLALAELTSHADLSANSLRQLLNQFVGGRLPPQTVPSSIVQQLPSSAPTTLIDFIEYSDELDVSLLEAIVAWVQIHAARVSSIVTANHDPTGTHLVLKVGVEENIIDAAQIYAGAVQIFSYARRQQEMFPCTLSWNDVLNALELMNFSEIDYPEIHQIVKHRRDSTPKLPLNLRSIQP
jgi:hypothetical protein